MPAKLPEPVERVTWRLDARDMELLRTLFGGRVNSHMREVVAAYCQRLRDRGLGNL